MKSQSVQVRFIPVDAQGTPTKAFCSKAVRSLNIILDSCQAIADRVPTYGGLKINVINVFLREKEPASYAVLYRGHRFDYTQRQVNDRFRHP